MIRAFILGMYEFRRNMTTHFSTNREYAAYDRARDFAHRVTGRRWDNV